ncbi:hypothetical protein DFH27DRAFT_547729 [Peziza echinospora]|nr:hypothetical protein DFH27DRAFT_547729 [Peziza echinospora]
MILSSNFPIRVFQDVSPFLFFSVCLVLATRVLTVGFILEVSSGLVEVPIVACTEKAQGSILLRTALGGVLGKCMTLGFGQLDLERSLNT